MKNRFLKILVVIPILFFISVDTVNAFVRYKSDLDWIDASCLDNNTCLALCSYYQTMQNTPANGVSPTDYYSGIYIYYYFDGNWQISWDKGFINGLGGSGKTVTRKGGVGSSDDAFNEYIFMQGTAYKNLVNKSVCPKYAYVDTGGWKF